MRPVAIVLSAFLSSGVDAAVSGTVVDAQSGAPIPKFSTVARPYGPRPLWQQHTVKHFEAGKFTITSRLWDFTLIRVWADGYRPETSAVIKKGDEQEIEFRLERDPGVRGKVVTEDGKPAAGVTVAWATLTTEPSITGGKVRLSSSAKAMGVTTVETAADGSFVLPSEIDPATVIAGYETGCAEVDPTQLDKPIVLQPWARIEGRLLLGHKPGADWLIYVSKLAGPDRDNPTISYREEVRTDAAGKFVVTHVRPGRVRIAPVVRIEDSTCSVTGVGAWIEVRAGLMTSLTLGGEGRPVIGKLVSADGAAIDWSKHKLRIRIDAPHIGFAGDNAMWMAQAEFLKAVQGARYGQHVIPDPDGTFRIDQVPQGEYKLHGIPINPRQAAVDVAPIEGGMTDEPLDLGELVVIAAAP